MDAGNVGSMDGLRATTNFVVYTVDEPMDLSSIQKIQARREHTFKRPQGTSIPQDQPRQGRMICEFCDIPRHTANQCRKKRTYKERKWQARLNAKGKVKEVRDGVNSQNRTVTDTMTDTGEESEQEKSTRPKSPEGIERLEEELNIIPDFLNLGVRE